MIDSEAMTEHNAILAEMYELSRELVGNTLVLRVAHKSTGVIIYTERKTVVNKMHLRSELYRFREYMLERNGLSQVILDDLIKTYNINPLGKSLRAILDEVAMQQIQLGHLNFSEDEKALIYNEVAQGKELYLVMDEINAKK